MGAGGVTGDKPVRLTVVSYEPGAARIMADRKYQVGLVLGEFYCTRAYLWPAADKWPNPREAEEVTFRRLRDARRGLRERLAERGPWWKG
jgi:hypothetical protein